MVASQRASLTSFAACKATVWAADDARVPLVDGRRIGMMRWPTVCRGDAGAGQRLGRVRWLSREHLAAIDLT